MKFDEAKKHIINRLEKDLADDLYYHGVHHTKDVCDSIERMIVSEKVSDTDANLLRTAALFHDAGFLVKYNHNEPDAVDLCYEILPRFEYTEDEIKLIGDIILSTQIDVRAKNLLEEIMCDADHDYLGREDYGDIAESLRRELGIYDRKITDLEWLDMQLYFLSRMHNYYTKSAKVDRQRQKDKTLLQLQIARTNLTGAD